MLTIFLSFAMAAFTLKPGLWEIENQVVVNGKQMDTANKMNERMKSMPAAQQEKMKKMLGNAGMGMGDGAGIKVCHTNKMNSEKALLQKDSNCKITDKKNLSDGVAFSFKCDNGSGKSEYHKISDTKYTGWNETQTDKGKMRMDFTGKFVATNCGDVKPLY